ncbi:EpsG family protein [Halomonas sp. B23F22_10]|uniref:EpsG family protein n=1 Tax=Halomonas sp. B23F22_10 TaxID=3459515 RepID=UPI00373E8C16
MTYELSFYLFVVLVGLALCFREIPSKLVYSFLTFFLFLSYSAVTRYSGFDIDINVYAEALKFDTFSIYYIKEPVYWLLSRYVYDFTGSPELTFICFDAVSFVLVLMARKNMDLPQYFPYLFLLFFPSVMGINNVYRQYLSCSIFIYFASLLFVDSSFFRRLFFLSLSFLTHNAAALFAPLIFSLNDKRNVGGLFFYSCLSILLLLPFALGTKSESDTGVLSAWAYLFVVIIFLLFYAFSYGAKFNNLSAGFFCYFLFLVFLIFFSAVLMGSAQSKRVGMYALMICLVPVVIAIEENYKQRFLSRSIVYVVLILPVFVFSSSLEMLLTQGE